MRSATAPFLALLLLTPSGCSRDGGDSEVCHDAADLCGASGEFDEEDCSGDQKAYAECIVDRGDCDPETLVECAGAGGGGGGDGGPGGGGSIELTVDSFTYEIALVDVAVEIRNVSEDDPIPVAPGLFQIEDEAANLHVAGGGVCIGGELLAAGGSERCDLQFQIGAAAPRALVYRDGQGRHAEASLAGLCSAGPESTEGSCRDGCSNDDDDFVDCDDYDCCDVVECPASTECGQQQQCDEGPEDTPDACSDDCSNDADNFIDCEDYDCCDVVACPPGTACGDM